MQDRPVTTSACHGAIRVNDPHPRKGVAFDLLEPLNQCTGIVYVFIFDRKEETNPHNRHPTHSRFIFIFDNESAVVSGFAIPP
jgi:hypothetical protein